VRRIPHAAVPPFLPVDTGTLTAMAASTFRLVARTLDSGFLGLPWEESLGQWRCDNLVDLERGIGRHVVRFVEIGGSFYALKELPAPLAQREYRLLGHLQGTNVPAVEPIAVVEERRAPGTGDELPQVLITRYLEFSLPFRTVLGRQLLEAPEAVLLDSLAGLLVRLHLAGFFWGDCSASNTLFRRDAGTLAAYLVDVETGELQERLSDGQRRHDLEIAHENLSYDFFDVAAEFGWSEDRDPTDLAQRVLDSYERLWAELTEDEIFGLHESSRLESRLRELNELGFDVDEIELERTEVEYRLRLPAPRGEPGYHRRRLLKLTGLDAQENQARRLLSDIAAFRAALERVDEPPVSESAVAGRWLSQVFEPTVAAIPADLRGKRAAAEIFHEILEHRRVRSEREGYEVPMAEAVPSYIDDVLRAAPDERTALLQPRRA
jgi:tRNA A-37 threonylcarbamoyl transferase component Bud32